VAIKIWSSAYSVVFTNLLLFSCMPFFIIILNICIILLMYILNTTGETSHRCLTALFINQTDSGTDDISMSNIGKITVHTETWYSVC
jgi:hypothetical protein